MGTWVASPFGYCEYGSSEHGGTNTGFEFLFSVLWGHEAQREISGSCGNSVFKVLSHHDTVFYTDSMILLTFPPAVYRVPICPHPRQTLVFWFCFNSIMVILMDVNIVDS